tara:strand:+ start:16969 stop:17652 length:684 start_codon:yes stop_codon:yes gene_type:complete
MKNILYIFSFLLATVAIAQTTSSIEFEKQKLKQAKVYGDKAVMASTMYSIIAFEGPKSSYKDSLAYLYYDQRNYISCFLVTNDILKRNPENLELLELKAISLESMGALEKAKEAYVVLSKKTSNNYHWYKLAEIQLRMNKNEDAYVSIKKADQLVDTGNLKITYQVNKNYNQNIELKAAIAYLEGLVAINLEKNNEAKISFERALKLVPDFVLAKGKLTSLEPVKEE